ncbi:hypothetical protein PybrP1_003026 [[Pythium] brassicae (nom. inval.)]|nr:hypothetical protein PybrP1_003026 [[Pythium] brassicae (nom. inval.)]
MWKRQVGLQQQTSEGKPDGSVARISLPNGEQIHDISKLYEKRCIKDEQRKAHRFMREGSRTARDPMQSNHTRQPLDPEFVMAQKLTGVPDAYYDTDCGNKKRSLEDATNPCLSAFSSTKDRFASTAAYRASTFATPESIGPGTYRAKKRAIQIKKQQVPTPSYISKAARFESAKAQVSAVLSSISGIQENSYHQSQQTRAYSPVFVRTQRPDYIRGPLLSTTPRFKSPTFPGAQACERRARPFLRHQSVLQGALEPELSVFIRIAPDGEFSRAL